MFDFKKLISSFGHAIRGLIYLLRYEQNFKIHVLFGIAALILGLILKIDYYEFLFILIIIAFVAMAEIVNTVLENILDVLHPDYHDKIKIIKDATAGVVLFASAVSIIIGIIIFGPKLINLV
ncbi:MAG: diacylglycerol kinase family protein [Patescibacteria group bacterium]